MREDHEDDMRDGYAGRICGTDDIRGGRYAGRMICGTDDMRGGYARMICGTDHLPEIDPAGLPFLVPPPPPTKAGR